LSRNRAKRRIFYFLFGKKEAALIKKQPLILQRIFGKSLDKSHLGRFRDLVDALDTFL
jgi:hypothetical protein